MKASLGHSHASVQMEWFTPGAPKSPTVGFDYRRRSDIPIPEHVLVAQEPDVWHQRLGHIGIKRWKQLIQGDLVTGLDISRPRTSFSPCDDCARGKSHATPSRAPATNRATEPLARLHIDLWGRTDIQAHGGFQYFLGIIDDYSRYQWVFGLRTKDAATAV